MREINVSSSVLKQTLGDIVAADARVASVFDDAGLDYCCHGHQTLEDAAAKRGIALPPLLARIQALGAASASDQVPATIDLDALTGHIVARHHGYVAERTPVIQAWLEKLVGRHGARHPELAEVRATFRALATDLHVHMAKEEKILFPYIDALAAAARAEAPAPRSPFGTIANPIRMMESEHEDAGELLERLHSLTNDYTPPPDGCHTFRLCYEELARFEADLHRHVHLENSVLFPRAIELEHRLG